MKKVLNYGGQKSYKLIATFFFQCLSFHKVLCFVTGFFLGDLDYHRHYYAPLQKEKKNVIKNSPATTLNHCGRANPR